MRQRVRGPDSGQWAWKPSLWYLLDGQFCDRLGSMQSTTDTANRLRRDVLSDGKPTNEHTSSEFINVPEKTAHFKSSMHFITKQIYWFVSVLCPWKDISWQGFHVQITAGCCFWFFPSLVVTSTRTPMLSYGVPKHAVIPSKALNQMIASEISLISAFWNGLKMRFEGKETS